MVTEEEMVTAKEKYKNVSWNPLTPLNFLKRSEWVFPDKIAVVDGDKNYTWKEFAERVYRLAHALKDKGVRKDDRVAILSRNNSAMLESFYGIGMAGAVSVPVNYRLTPKEIAYILNHSESKILIVEHDYAESVATIREELETVEFFIEILPPGLDEVVIGTNYDEFLSEASSEPVDVPVQDELDMISIGYTSGTTGTSKGCVYTHRGAYLNSLGDVITVQMNSDSSYLWTLPMFHCMGWNFVWAVTAVGAKHVCLDVVRAEQIYSLIDGEKVTHMAAAPAVYLTLADYMKKNYLRLPGRVKGFIGGAAPSFQLIAEVEHLGIEIVHAYGLTEVYGPHTICEWNSEWEQLPLAERARLKARQGVPYVIWTPVKVVDESMNEVPWDGKTQGEIVMQGNNVMQWYFKEQERTDKAFEGGWFHSGDAAVVHPDGYIEIVDRLKDIIVSGGENIPSHDVEKVIAEHPAVFDVAVFGKPDKKWGEVASALVQLRPGETVSREEIIEWCKDRLARFKAPKEVEFGEVPRTSTGKIQKHILRQREG